MKGQINLEFLAAALIYLISLGILITIGNSVFPDFSNEVKEASLNLEAKQVSTGLLSSSGHHSFGSGGSNWEKNNTTIKHADSVGIATGYLKVSRQKLMNLRTADPRRNDFNYLNYSQFKRISEADNQYRFEFTWMPIIETSKEFTRGSPPADPPIQEPNTNYYDSAGNIVHYGKERIKGSTYHFLVTSHNGVYNTTYISNDWDFVGRTPYGVEDNPIQFNNKLQIEKFQNRVSEKGSLLILSNQLKTFGASVDSDARVISMERFAIMEGEPLKVRILAW